MCQKYALITQMIRCLSDVVSACGNDETIFIRHDGVINGFKAKSRPDFQPFTLNGSSELLED